jgi:hypothetical protein
LNFLILIAGILSILSSLIHIIAGEKTNIAQLFKTDIQLSHKIELRDIWYTLGIDLVITGFLLGFIGFKNSLIGYELLILSIPSFHSLWYCHSIDDNTHKKDYLLKIP